MAHVNLSKKYFEKKADEYSNATALRFTDTRLQKLNLCIEQKSSVTLTSGNWYDVGTIKTGYGFGGCSPITILAHTNGGVPLLVCFVPEDHNSKHINKIRRHPQIIFSLIYLSIPLTKVINEIEKHKRGLLIFRLVISDYRLHFR